MGILREVFSDLRAEIEVRIAGCDAQIAELQGAAQKLNKLNNKRTALLAQLAKLDADAPPVDQ